MFDNIMREKLFVLMYQSDFHSNKKKLTKEDMIESTKSYVENSSCDEEIEEVLHILDEDDEAVVNFYKISEYIELIDRIIKRNLKNWTLPRVGRIELSICRLATYELMILKEESIGEVISNYLNIAKKYFVDKKVAEKSSSFINGVMKNVLEEK